MFFPGAAWPRLTAWGKGKGAQPGVPSGPLDPQDRRACSGVSVLLIRCAVLERLEILIPSRKFLAQSYWETLASQRVIIKHDLPHHCGSSPVGDAHPSSAWFFAKYGSRDHALLASLFKNGALA